MNSKLLFAATASTIILVATGISIGMPNEEPTGDPTGVPTGQPTGEPTGVMPGMKNGVTAGESTGKQRQPSKYHSRTTSEGQQMVGRSQKRYRRGMGYHTICIRKPKKICTMIQYGGVLKQYCIVMNKWHCVALD